MRFLLLVANVSGSPLQMLLHFMLEMAVDFEQDWYDNLVKPKPVLKVVQPVEEGNDISHDFNSCSSAEVKIVHVWNQACEPKTKRLLQNNSWISDFCC